MNKLQLLGALVVLQHVFVAIGSGEGDACPALDATEGGALIQKGSEFAVVRDLVEDVAAPPKKTAALINKTSDSEAVLDLVEDEEKGVKAARDYEEHANSNCDSVGGWGRDVLRGWRGTVETCKSKCDELKCIGFIRLSDGRCFFRGNELSGVTAANGRSCFIPRVPCACEKGQTAPTRTADTKLQLPLTGASGPEFDDVDLNGNGVINRTEYAAAMEVIKMKLAPLAHIFNAGDWVVRKRGTDVPPLQIKKKNCDGTYEAASYDERKTECGYCSQTFGTRTYAAEQLQRDDGLRFKVGDEVIWTNGCCGVPKNGWIVGQSPNGLFRVFFGSDQWHHSKNKNGVREVYPSNLWKANGKYY